MLWLFKFTSAMKVKLLEQVIEYWVACKQWKFISHSYEGCQEHDQDTSSLCLSQAHFLIHRKVVIHIQLYTKLALELEWVHFFSKPKDIAKRKAYSMFCDKSMWYLPQVPYHLVQ
ncbi:hypothetical protein STEG23_025339, partial [Scotinomys teguina]